MRVSPLKEKFSAVGASFMQRNGVEVCSLCSGLAAEYRFVREAVGVTDFTYMQKYRIPEENAIDFLDKLVAGNVAKVRFGRVLHTFLADDNGFIIADCYIANNDQEFILLCESLVDDATLDEILKKHGAEEAGLENITQSHVAIGVDGYKAWAIAKELFGSDVLGLPYLSIEMYPFESETIKLIRAGKTSEFGYLLIAPVTIASALFERVAELAVKNNGGMCGVKTHNELRLEGRFFNVFAEGERVKDPLSLGLQWMIDFDKETFVGRDAIMSRRENGVAQKIIGVRAEATPAGFAPETLIYDGEQQLGPLVATCFSSVLNASIGLALLPVPVAYSGLTFRLGSGQGVEVRTISMPPIMPKSLTVKLDEL